MNIRYGDMKKDFAEDMVQFITPIRQKAQDLLKDEQIIKQIMEKGAVKANKSANETMKIVRSAMGMDY